MTFRMLKPPARAAADVAAREAGELDRAVLEKAVALLEEMGRMTPVEADAWRARRGRSAITASVVLPQAAGRA